MELKRETKIERKGKGLAHRKQGKKKISHDVISVLKVN
jgi:hypothetical protein